MVGGGGFKIEFKQTIIEYSGYGNRSHGISVTIDIHDIGKYAADVKSELNELFDEGYSVEDMMAMTGLIKLQEESPSWLSVDTSDALETYVIVET